MNSLTHGILVMALVGMVVFSTGCKSPNTGLEDNMLKPCPSSPNCFSSMAKDTSHYIDPLTYEGSKEDAKNKLISIIQSTKRATVVEEDADYIHAEYTSLIFRFVDDVEFYFDDQAPVIQIRSASRVGYSDLGANRKRIEKIRKEFNE